MNATNATTQTTTLVLGGTGKTGRRVAERLRSRGTAVRIGSRAAEPPFDWTDGSTWGPALHGVSAAYVSYYPDIAVPGAPEAIGALAEEAVAQGVERMVLLSGRREEEAQRAEAILGSSGLEWTVVRCAWFDQNFSENFMLDPIRAGELALPAGDMREPFVDADDIADVAAAALTEDGHANRVYELTGPRLMTFGEAVDEIARATGREVRYVPVTIDEYTGALAGHELPEELIGLLRYLFTEILDGRNAELADGVQQALGRKPRDFSDYARDAASTGVWDV